MSNWVSYRHYHPSTRLPRLPLVPVCQIFAVVSLLICISFVIVHQPNPLNTIIFLSHNPPRIVPLPIDLLESPYLFRSPAPTLTYSPALHELAVQELRVGL